jgi:hypothetical protein
VSLQKEKLIPGFRTARFAEDANDQNRRIQASQLTDG